MRQNRFAQNCNTVCRAWILAWQSFCSGRPRPESCTSYWGQHSDNSEAKTHKQRQDNTLNFIQNNRKKYIWIKRNKTIENHYYWQWFCWLCASERELLVELSHIEFPQVLISRGLQLEGQVVTEEQDLQVMVMTMQKNSPLQYLHASAMQDRVRTAVAQSQVSYLPVNDLFTGLTTLRMR